MKKEYVIGIDLGGTKVEACLLDSERKILKRCRKPSGAARGLDWVVKNIWGVVSEAANGKSYSAVGIGTPGTYVSYDDCLYGSPHTPLYETPGFIGQIKEKLSMPVVVENDANCLALAEYFASCAGKYHCVMAVILGTGVGSGLILNEKLYRGARGGAGEIGHATIDIAGRLCECGRRGCVEAYLSGPSLSRRFYEKSSEKLNVPDIYNLYQEGNKEAVLLFEESSKIMGEVFADMTTVLDLDAIILGGGVSNIPIWYDKVPSLMLKSTFGVNRDYIPLIKAKMGDSAGVVGAAYLALRERGFMNF